jgi:hypothetical protein
MKGITIVAIWSFMLIDLADAFQFNHGTMTRLSRQVSTSTIYVPPICNKRNRYQSMYFPIYGSKLSVNVVSDEREKAIHQEELNITVTSFHTSAVANDTLKVNPIGEGKLPLSDNISNLFLSPQVQILDALLMVMSSFFVALSTLPVSSMPQGFDTSIVVVTDALTYIFGIAFFLRWYGVGQLKMEYLRNPFTILDIVVSVIPLAAIVPTFGFINMPSWLMSNSGLVNLRLLRILRFSRILQDMETFAKFEIALGLKPSAVKSYQLELARVILSIFTLISVSTGLIYTAEHKVNPDIPDYFTALYFGLTTLTTGMVFVKYSTFIVT